MPDRGVTPAPSVPARWCSGAVGADVSGVEVAGTVEDSTGGLSGDYMTAIDLP